MLVHCTIHHKPLLIFITIIFFSLSSAQNILVHARMCSTYCTVHASMCSTYRLTCAVHTCSHVQYLQAPMCSTYRLPCALVQ